jgi:hypothetical protein
MQKNEKLQLTEKDGKLTGGFMPLSSEKMMKIKGGTAFQNNSGTCSNRQAACSGTNSGTCNNATGMCGGTTNSGNCITVPK